MEKIMIKVNNVVKTYKIYDKPIDRLKEAIFPFVEKKAKEFNALNGLTFEIKKGEAVGILGKNGSGKSTLLKIITGVLTQTEGEVITNGKISSILELGTGFNMDYTGIENIYLNGTIFGYTKKQMDERLEKIIEFADIGDFINQPVKLYSSGMFARLAFAVAINVEPEILIIDEALAVGDTRFQIKCIDKLKELKDNGTTILFVSHAIEQVKRFCNRAIWLKDGKIQADGESSEICDIYEDFMRFGEMSTVINALKKKEKTEREFIVPQNTDAVAVITNVEINKEKFSTFDELEVTVTYEIYEEKIEGFLLGVAIYTADRKGYIFGPNTYLEKVEIPNDLGRHKVSYSVNKLPLIKGSYTIDAGIFTNGGIVNLNYKQSAVNFFVSNNYFTEGEFYIEHKWNIKR